MKTIGMLSGLLLGVLGFLIGWFVFGAIAMMFGVPHPMAWGLVLFLGSSAYTGFKSYKVASSERLARSTMLQASVERQANAQREYEVLRSFESRPFNTL